MPEPGRSEREATAAAAAAGLAFALAWLVGPPLPWTLAGAVAAGFAVTGRPADAARGWLCGAIAYGGALAWLPGALGRFGLPPLGAAPLVVLQAMVPAVALGWTGLAVRAGTDRAVAAGLAWCAAAGLARVAQPLPVGPELALGTAPALLAPAAAGGTALLAGVLFAWGSVARAPVAGALWGLTWLATGVALLPAADPFAGPRTRVGVVQPQIGTDRRSSAAGPRADRVRSGAWRAAADGAAWVATPEVAWPWDAGADGSTARRHTVEGWPGVPVVLGAVTADPTNALLVIDGGRLVDRFDKRALVPLAERSVAGLGVDRYVAGTGRRRLTAGVPIAPLICYEDVLPGALAEVEGDLLLVAAHDAWLGPTGAAQHLAATRLAAASTGRFTVRAAGSGPSAVVDPAGRLAGSTPWVDVDARPRRPVVVVADVPRRQPRWWGARLSPLLSALCAGALLAARQGGRR